ncbi:MAG TPA: enoyl-CoA hydratase/isomerase family protein [Blastocatellia bacterium]|nr:enoyl-CoA hydratase/isomerase family protein [Blastocatellia bacterium]
MLITEQRGAVLLLTLDRPEKRNALHPDLIAKLTAKLEEAAESSEVNAVILTGAGKSFCAGLDLSFVLEASFEEKIVYLENVFAMFQRIYTQPQPVIAAINGPAIAGGFDLAVMCDFRLCSPEATFAQTEILLGLTQMIFPLYKIIGLGRAKELAMTGEIIHSNEAHRIGLVNHVCDSEQLLNSTMSLAETLAARPRQALFETKRLTRELIDVDTQTAFRRMGKAIRERLQSEEHQKMATEFVAKLKQRN